MASKGNNSENAASISAGLTQLFLRKLTENIARKNQNPGRRIVIKQLKSVYAYEIRCMMHTLGDAECPLKSSILYLETVLRDQMNLLLIKASENPDSAALTHEPLLNLLVSKREKVTRLLHYLYLKDSSELLGKRKYEEFVDVVINTQFGIRVETCLEFLRTIDPEEYNPEAIKSASDDIALERVARRFQMSRTMTNEQYLSFSKEQSVCFYPKGDDGKFKKWLLSDKVTKLQPTALALDIMAFFARETIAEMVEASLLIRQSENIPKSDLDFPSISVNCDSQSKSVKVKKFIDDSDLVDVNKSPFRSSKIPGLTNFIADCTDSNSDISSLINSGVLGMADIFALSTSSLYDKDAYSPLEESPYSSNRIMETMDSFAKSDDEESIMGESPSAKVSRPRSNVQKPKSFVESDDEESVMGESAKDSRYRSNVQEPKFFVESDGDESVMGESAKDSRSTNLQEPKSFVESDEEESVMLESAKESRPRSKIQVQEPKIPARDPYDPITLEDLRTAVMDLIMTTPGKIGMNKTKRILCL